MVDPADKLTPATVEDIADALAFAQRFHGRKRTPGDRRRRRD